MPPFDASFPAVLRVDELAKERKKERSSALLLLRHCLAAASRVVSAAVQASVVVAGCVLCGFARASRHA
eukprot:641671-Rhodomonas_salina.1